MLKARYNKKAKKFLIAEENGKLLGLQTEEQLKKVYPDYKFDFARKNPKQWFYL